MPSLAVLLALLICPLKLGALFNDHDHYRESHIEYVEGRHTLAFEESGFSIRSASHKMEIHLEGGHLIAPIVTSRPNRYQITYLGVWDGVSVTYEPSPHGLVKSTYHIRTGHGNNSVESIRIKYDRPTRINAGGELSLAFESGVMRESPPIAWQEADGKRIPVDVKYRILSEFEIGFEVGPYDRSLDLIIDPLLTWNTFLGEGGYDIGDAIAVDGSGNTYIAGRTDSAWDETPIRAYSAGDDTFVVKLDSDGNLVWHTFLGGAGADYGKGIALDGSGNIIVTGYSNATWGSPKQSYTASTDAFIAKIATDGSLTWSTFLGGSGTDTADSIAVDSSGNIYVGGDSEATWGSPKRSYTAGIDGFAAKFDGNGNLSWNTFLGGNMSDYGYGIALDGSANAYVTGISAASWGSPKRAYTGSTDGFVAKIGSDGTFAWNTFLGCSVADYSYGIAADSSGNTVVAGYSSATWESPKRAYTHLEDAFAARLDANGTLTWNTFLGGEIVDVGTGVALDGDGNVYVSGYSTATWGSPKNAFKAIYDAFAVKLASDGSLTWNTFIGGDRYDYGYGIAVDGSRNPYIVGASSATWGTPVRSYSSSYDVFVASLPETPTAVELDSFEAIARERSIELVWHTRTERDNAGFHLWRSDDGDSDYARITGSLIPARGDAINGSYYSFDDYDVLDGQEYCYILEDIDMSGKSTLHGPIRGVMGTIELLFPANGQSIPSGDMVRLSWSAGPFSSFKVELSFEESFINIWEIIEPKWVNETYYDLRKKEIDSLKGMSGNRKAIYWRVRGMTPMGIEAVSKSHWFWLE